jgi:hypothetical protein
LKQEAELRRLNSTSHSSTSSFFNPNTRVIIMQKLEKGLADATTLLVMPALAVVGQKALEDILIPGSYGRFQNPIF